MRLSYGTRARVIGSMQNPTHGDDSGAEPPWHQFPRHCSTRRLPAVACRHAFGMSRSGLVTWSFPAVSLEGHGICLSRSCPFTLHPSAVHRATVVRYGCRGSRMRQPRSTCRTVRSPADRHAPGPAQHPGDASVPDRRRLAGRGASRSDRAWLNWALSTGR